jgi:ABC-type glycerol-3-phosphate transport system permease component
MWLVAVAAASPRVLTHLNRSDGRQVLLATLSFALLAALAQTGWGFVLACAVRDQRPLLRRSIVSLLVLVYCLQPVLVQDLWERLLNWPKASFVTLTAASIWQFAPFATLYFLLAMDRVDAAETWLTLSECSNGVARWRQVFGTRIARAAVAIATLRFLWTFTKYDLPFAFFNNSGGGKVLAIRVGQGTRAEAMEWAGVMLVGLALVSLTYLLLQKLTLSMRDRVRPPPIFVPALIPASSSKYQLGRASRPTRMPRVLSVVGLACVVLELLPLARGAAEYLPPIIANTPDDLFRGIWPSLRLTLLIGISAAALSTLGAALLAYAAARGASRIQNVWRHVPLLTYAVPLALLSVMALDTLATLRAHLAEIAAAVMGAFGSDSSSLARLLTTTLPNGVMVTAAYVVFSMPFAFALLHDIFRSPRNLAMEQLALVDGMRAGLRFQWRFVAKYFMPALIYTAFLSFVINWQDLTFASRVQADDFELFSYRLRFANPDMPNAQHMAIAFAASVLMSLAFFVLVPSFQRMLAREETYE